MTHGKEIVKVLEIRGNVVICEALDGTRITCHKDLLNGYYYSEEV